MAVLSELIDVGLTLKRQGKLKGAIEHFKQLRATYPENARIIFELAVCWSAFDVPEQALPLYRELIARPKGKGLPAKDLPRLYTRLGAALYALQEYDEALSILNDGLRLYPSYRPLRAYRIFALHAAAMPGSALTDALELMLESLAPSRWDTFEDLIRQIVQEMRAAQDESADAAGSSVADADGDAVEDEDQRVLAKPTDAKNTVSLRDASAAAANQATGGDIVQRSEPNRENKIAIELADTADEDFELDVKVVPGQSRARKSKKSRDERGQLGKKSVRIDISAGDDDSDPSSDDDAPATPTGKVQIPIDKD